MLLRQLECFSALIEQGSFTKAAKVCHISQPAMSQQLKTLERELGHELVRREGRRLSLTPEGEAVLRAAHDVLDRVDRLHAELDESSAGGLHELHVGYLSRYEGWEVPSAIAAFTLRHPEVAVSATGGSHDGLYRMALAGELDIIFNDRRRELSDEFTNVYLMTCYTVVEISEASPLAGRERVTVRELADAPCILIARDEQRDVERAYYRDVMGFSSPIVFAGTLEEARMMVAGNRGFLPLEARSPEGPHGGAIRRIPLMGPAGQLAREYYAFWPARRGNWAVREFARILKGLF